MVGYICLEEQVDKDFADACRRARLRRMRTRLQSDNKTLAGLARDGKTNRAGVPKNPLRFALILREYEEEIYFVRPPLAVQRVILRALARVARLLGYRAEYPYPHAWQSKASRTVM
jgi:hypothetical protein